MRLWLKITVLILSCALFSCAAAMAQEQPPPFDPENARKAAEISDPEAATRAYLDSVPEERRQKTKAYARGNYILDATGFVYSSLVLIGLLAFGVSAKMRDVAARVISEAR